MSIIQRLICRYIANNLGHENREFRENVFKAIDKGLRNSFPEDNIYSRLNFIGFLLGQNYAGASDYRLLNTCLRAGFSDGVNKE